MKCPLCQVEMRITRSRNVIEFDEEQKPKLFIEQDLTCLTKTCPNYDKVVTTVKNEQPLG